MSTPGDRLVPTPLGWHPLTIAGVMAALAVATAGATAAGSAAGGAGWATLTALTAWLVMGAAAGFATSGSV
jgi:hypothetical protein